jgi:signal transduction histidine kinase
LLEASERELERVARELHDGLGQHITGLSMLHSTLLRKLVPQQSPEAEIAQQLAAVLEKARGELRRISRNLHGVNEGECNLPSRIHEFLLDVQQQRTAACTFECNEPVRLAPAVATQLFRIVQGAVSDAISARGASEVAIALRRTEAHYTLEIADDGQPASGNPAASSALAVLRCRAEAVGGALEIVVPPRKGLVIMCTFPNIKFGPTH